MKLTAEQKCDIATRELEELREDIERMKEESDKILDDYKVFDYFYHYACEEGFFACHPILHCDFLLLILNAEPLLFD